MTLEQAVFNYLSTFAGLTALVATRIYPQRLPQQTTFPAVTYRRVTTQSVQSHSGSSNLARGRFQFDCWSRDYQEARAVARQVTVALDGFKGTLGSPSGVPAAALAQNDVDLYDPETQLYHPAVDVAIWHQEG